MQQAPVTSNQAPASRACNAANTSKHFDTGSFVGYQYHTSKHFDTGSFVGYQYHTSKQEPVMKQVATSITNQGQKNQASASTNL